MKGPLPGERIDAPAIVRGIPASRHRQHRGDQLLLRAVEREQRFEYAELVAAILDLAGQRVELAREVAERKVLRRQRGDRAAARRRLAEHELLRLEARQLGEPLAQRVEPQ